jgi:Coenzyme PQQ synthesis protein D (PqqD)
MQGGQRARVAINRGPVIHETIDDEVIVIHLVSGNYYSLRKSGKDIWHLLEHGATLDQIVDVLAERSTTPRQEVDRSVRRLVDDLLREDLAIVTVVGDGPSIGIAASSNGAGRAVEEFAEPKLERYTDMQDLVLLDPVHEVGPEGWPHRGDPEDVDSSQNAPSTSDEGGSSHPR